MNLALWVIQGLLAPVYLAAGIMKVSQPVESPGKRLNWVNAVSPGTVRFIGAAEFFGALGLILPLVTGILPWPWSTGGWSSFRREPLPGCNGGGHGG